MNTNFMTQSPSWEADRSSATQEIPRVLWNPKVHRPILSQIDPINAPPPSMLSKIYFNIILPVRDATQWRNVTNIVM
jgi:hypothetical protein